MNYSIAIYVYFFRPKHVHGWSLIFPSATLLIVWTCYGLKLPENFAMKTASSATLLIVLTCYGLKLPENIAMKTALSATLPIVLTCYGLKLPESIAITLQCACLHIQLQMFCIGSTSQIRKFPVPHSSIKNAVWQTPNQPISPGITIMP